MPASAAADQGPHDGRVAARAVERHLDGQDVRVVGRLLDEPLHGPAKRLVRVVEQDVAVADGGEDVDRLVLVERLQALRR